MTHPGQRLSALIDGELEGSARERVLMHLMECDSCCQELAALRTVKRRVTSALRETDAGAGLTRRLIGLGSLAGTADSGRADDASPPPPWPNRPAGLPERGQPSTEQRTARYFLAGSLAVFLAGLGTAAFIAGGEPQSQAPTPPVAPSVDVMVFPHGAGGGIDAVPRVARSSSTQSAVSAAHISHIRT